MPEQTLYQSLSAANKHQTQKTYHRFRATEDGTICVGDQSLADFLDAIITKREGGAAKASEGLIDAVMTKYNYLTHGKTEASRTAWVDEDELDTVLSGYAPKRAPTDGSEQRTVRWETDQAK